jgi:ankyrin repeat protein
MYIKIRYIDKSYYDDFAFVYKNSKLINSSDSNYLFNFGDDDWRFDDDHYDLIYDCSLSNKHINHKIFFRIVLNGRYNIIVSDKYCISDVELIIKLNLKITTELLYYVFMVGNITTLEYLKKNNKIYNAYSSLIKKISLIDIISMLGHVNVLEWLKNSGLELKYSEKSLHYASGNRHINVLNWWKNSGLPLKYNENPIDRTSLLGNIDILEWWKNSGLPLKYSNNAFEYASMNNHINVLEWWRNSGFVLKYTDYILYNALLRSSIGILEWWKNIGLLKKDSKFIMPEGCSMKSLEWLVNNGYKVPISCKLCYIFYKIYKKIHKK